MQGKGGHPQLGQAGFLSQRTWGILMVLCVLMVGAYWMAKKAGNNKTTAQVNTANGKEPAAALASAPSSAPRSALSTASVSAPTPNTASTVSTASPDRFGLTFGHGMPPSPSGGLMVSACAGIPLDMGNPHKNQCNPTQGDTSCRTALPVLCALKDGSTAESAGLSNESKSEGSATATLYADWMGGSLAATAPVAGFVIGSRAQANARCEGELGAGWRMAELHDATSGLGLVGKRGHGLANTNTRHWIAINDQKSNCWDPS